MSNENENIEEEELTTQLVNAMKGIEPLLNESERDFKAFKLYRDNPVLTKKEIAQIVDLTPTRISQISKSNKWKARSINYLIYKKTIKEEISLDKSLKKLTHIYSLIEPVQEKLLGLALDNFINSKEKLSNEEIKEHFKLLEDMSDFWSKITGISEMMDLFIEQRRNQMENEEEN